MEQSHQQSNGSSQNSACTLAQRHVIANQVKVAKLFRLPLKYGEPLVIPEHLLQHLSPPPLDSPNQSVKIIGKSLDDLGKGYLQKHLKKSPQQHNTTTPTNNTTKSPSNDATKQTPPGTNVNGQTSAARAITPPLIQEITQHQQIEIIPRPGPLYTMSNNNRTTAAPQPTGYLPREDVDSSLALIIKQECQRRMQQQLKSRLTTLDAVIKNPSSDPGMTYKSSTPPFGAALLQLRMVRALNRQRELRTIIDKEGQDILHLPERTYKMLLKTNRSIKIDQARKDISNRAEIALNRIKDIKAFRSDVMPEINASMKELKAQRTRGVTRIHDRLHRERNKLKEDDASMRLEALKAYDFEAYQEILRKQAGNLPAAGEKYEAITRFLADTEAYLHRLAGKIASVKMTAEASNAASKAIADARARGLSEEEVQAAARTAAAEAASGNEALRLAAENAGDAQSVYYQLAHSNREDIADQPTLLRPPNGAKLREYQLIGLQWMVSLYNNHLNGILADEMGLGKTVQVMALIAYLMEKKNNYGPHLIIVPNAVIVNWKSELTQWLPVARCVYYVGGKEERARKYTQEVQPLQFNVLVTTYEFIMRDRTKLSKIDWQYIVIDEAQRMKDRQSKLSKDLDRFNATRRLLLSGTPLQNDLQELWSLLNLLLPDVFDNKKDFAEWFGEAIASTAGQGGGDDWLEKEKRVVVIHRLHQILEPFMLRRQVEDVESKLPPKKAFTVHCAMSAHQSIVYSWVRATGTLRLNPSAPLIGKVRREWASLQNKCMELRKICNHPLLSYPPPSWAVGSAIIKECGKMVTLDRMLVKLKASGHRVLLFSTMTKLLDLLELYLQWRQLPDSIVPGGGTMKYLRIDGSTSLEDREAAIQQFNAPDSDAFLFLLSIRAAGRGLNLQSSDTVIIYDPDPNPKNEEQAIARSHRIGQTKEVRVFHMEAVADAPPSNTQDVDNGGDGSKQMVGGGDGIINNNTTTTITTTTTDNNNNSNEQQQPQERKRYYADSIESLVRGQIQKIKIEMANEIIDAGRFDQQTSMEERRHTLEALLQDQDRNRKATNQVPSWHDLNEMIARSPEELTLFEELDKKEDLWYPPSTIDEVPKWMQWNEDELRRAMTENAKHKVDVEAEMAALTGMVLHHHGPSGGGGGGQGNQSTTAGQQKQLGGVKAAGMPSSSSQQQQQQRQPTAASVQQQPLQQTTAPKRVMSFAEPAMTTTTARSTGLEGDDDYEEVGMEDNDEEEEILEQNLIDDDVVTTDSGMNVNVSNPLKRAAVGSDGDNVVDGVNGGGGDNEEQPAKRAKTLSVHFMGEDGSGE